MTGLYLLYRRLEFSSLTWYDLTDENRYEESLQSLVEAMQAEKEQIITAENIAKGMQDHDKSHFSGIVLDHHTKIRQFEKRNSFVSGVRG